MKCCQQATKMVTGTWPLSLASWRENVLLKGPLVHPPDGYQRWLLSSHTGLTHLDTGFFLLLPLPARALCLAPGRRSRQVCRWQDLKVGKKPRHQAMMWDPRTRIQDLISEQESPEEDATVTRGWGEIQQQPR